MQLYEDNFVEIMQLYIICDELSSELSDKNTKNRLSLIKMRKNKIGWSKKYVYDKYREIYYDSFLVITGVLRTIRYFHLN